VNRFGIGFPAATSASFLINGRYTGRRSSTRPTTWSTARWTFAHRLQRTERWPGAFGARARSNWPRACTHGCGSPEPRCPRASSLPTARRCAD